ncbi:MAG: DNA polymerase III subunit gamma/tau [Pseudomonadota bacterium]
MSEYRVLARKYRPTSFAELIGQTPMVQTLSNAFLSGRIAQAYMLTGVRGVGKTTTARILARALNYQSETVDQPDISLPGTGVHCPDIMSGNHVDVIELDAASHTGIGDIREIISSVRYRPVSARYKVYIIDEVHMLSNAAFNGLLKTLEEPPEHVKFIFATTEIRKVPVTILSRCQRFDLRRVDVEQMHAHLASICEKENVDPDSEALSMIARAADGSVRDGLSILDQALAHASSGNSANVVSLDGDSVRGMLGLADRARIVDLFEQVMKGEIAKALVELDSQYDAGADPATILSDLAAFCHLVTKMRVLPEFADEKSLSEIERKRGAVFAETLSLSVLNRFWQIVQNGISEVSSATNPLQSADMVMVRLVHASTLPSPEDLLKDQNGQSVGSTDLSSRSIVKAKSASPSSPSTVSGAGNVVPIANRGSRAQSLATEAMPNSELPEPEAQPAARQWETIASFEDLLRVAEEKRDIAFKLALRNNIRLVHFEPGKMEVNLVGTPPRNLLSDISNKLMSWTGERWMIATSTQEGALSFREQEDQHKAALMEDAEQNSAVTAILSHFPKSRIIDVRVSEAIDSSTADPGSVPLPDEDSD